MLLDLQTMFSGSVASDGTKTGQGITATAISANVLDLRNSTALAAVDDGLNPADGCLIVQVQTSAAGGDAAKTLTITLESSSTADLATSPVVHAASGAILGSALVAGAMVAKFWLPSADYKRYLGLRYTVSAGFTSFNILAYLSDGLQRNTLFPAAFTIDA